MSLCTPLEFALEIVNWTILPGKSGEAGRKEESDTLLSSWPETKRPGSELAQF